MSLHQILNLNYKFSCYEIENPQIKTLTDRLDDRILYNKFGFRGNTISETSLKIPKIKIKTLSPRKILLVYTIPIRNTVDSEKVDEIEIKCRYRKSNGSITWNLIKTDLSDKLLNKESQRWSIKKNEIGRLFLNDLSSGFKKSILVRGPEKDLLLDNFLSTLIFFDESWYLKFKRNKTLKSLLD